MPEAPPPWPGREIAARLDDRDLVFVFPSQAAADAWAAEAPLLFGRASVERSRFVGWDRLKEERLSTRRAERPADRLSRLVWAAGVVARQAERPFLARLAGRGRPGRAFVPYLAGFCPDLGRITRALEGAPAAARSGETARDLLALGADYRAFLAAKGLFEPSWEPPAEAPPGLKALIVAPELVEDFEERAPALARAPGVELLPLPPAAAFASARRFPNSFEEFRAAFLEIGELLDSGWEPDEIAVTLPGLEAARPWLERAAAQAGVPIAVRAGRPLSDSPFARVLRSCRAAAASGLAFAELRALLLDRFAAFREAESARALVRYGVERHVVAPWVEGGRRIDPWEESFARCGAPRGLASFHRRLRAALLALSGARDFAALGSAVSAFRAQFLDESGWPEAERRRVERAMRELASLARAEAELGAAGRLLDPLGLFLDSLSGVGYVPQSRGAAVPVYPFRVSALVPARRHYLLNASEEAARAEYGPPRVLGEELAELLGFRRRDASADFLRAYSLSGSDPRASWAEEAVGGFAVPHPALARLGAEAPDGAARAEAPPACPLAAEAAAWRGEGALPDLLLPFQAAAAAAGLAAAGTPPRRYPARREGRATPPSPGTGPEAATPPSGAASPAAREAALARMRRPDGLLRISATSIEEYLACPFAWLLSRGLGLREEASGPDFFDARLEGSLAHAALDLLIERMGALGPLSLARLAEYEPLAAPAAAEALESFAGREGPFLEPMGGAYLPLLVDRLRRLAAETARRGGEAGELELALELPEPGRGRALEGRLDRLHRRGEAWAVVDYKKRGLPKAADLRPDAEGELGDYQMAAYVLLAEAAGRPVGSAGFWSVEEAEALDAIGDSAPPREEYSPALEAFRRAYDRAAEGLLSGDFGPAPGKDSCGRGPGGCPWSPVCRERYAARGRD